ncbi:hypothetical protein MBLNU459_g7371t1 [Dothideomycetes sp. NU459]
MPPKRSSSMATARSQRSQSTLSFNKQGRNRVTKPVVAQRDTKASRKEAALLDITAVDVEREVKEPTPAETAIAEQAVSDSADPLQAGDVNAEDVLGGRAPTSDAGALGGQNGSGWQSDEEVRARKTSEAQIKTYWRKKEQERKAPRVHQQGLSVHEKVLREWDMSGQYGPCIGIARLKRWKRANMLNLNPPLEVLAVLLKEADMNNAGVQRAHVDELMSSRFVET